MASSRVLKSIFNTNQHTVYAVHLAGILIWRFGEFYSKRQIKTTVNCIRFKLIVANTWRLVSRSQTIFSFVWGWEKSLHLRYEFCVTFHCSQGES